MTSNMLVIAHRGASGYLPEHTREAKVLAYGQGADFLEQDVVATRDGQLVVLHDIYLDDVSDVADRFPSRSRSDGRHYVIDFDLMELRELRLMERRRAGTHERLRPGRFDDAGLTFRIVTLDEEIRLITELNRTTGRAVGLYPEIKRPDWHRQHGIDLSLALLETLGSHGYRDSDSNVFVQCFDAAELRRCREAIGTTLRLVQLVDETGFGTALPATLARIAEYANVVALHYSQIVGRAGTTRAPVDTSSDALARDDISRAGLALHCYTLRRDAPALDRSFEDLLAFLFSAAGVDALFCDHPDVAVSVRNRLRHSGA